MVSVGNIPSHPFYGVESRRRIYSLSLSLSRSLLRPSHFIVRDDIQLHYSAPLSAVFQYSQLRVIREQENRRPPRFLRNFLDSRVSPPKFLK